MEELLEMYRVMRPASPEACANEAEIYAFKILRSIGKVWRECSAVYFPFDVFFFFFFFCSLRQCDELTLPVLTDRAHCACSLRSRS